MVIDRIIFNDLFPHLKEWWGFYRRQLLIKAVRRTAFISKANHPNHSFCPLNDRKPLNRYLDRKLIDTRSPWLPSICLRSACVALKLTFCTRNGSSIFENLTISCVLAHEQARMDSARSFHIKLGDCDAFRVT